MLGDAQLRIHGAADLEAAGPTDVSFFVQPRYLAALRRSRAGAVLTAAPVPDLGCVQIVCANPYLAMAHVAHALQPPRRPAPGVHPSAFVHPSAQLATGVRVGPTAVVEAEAIVGANCWLEAGAFVGTGAELGEGCHLHPGARLLRRCRAGARTILHSGAVIGSDGFGYAVDAAGQRVKIPQLGIVELGEDVEVGANTTVDRATFGATRIGRGSKIDNLVQIGHNCQIGAHCVFVAQSGSAGSTVFGDFVVAGARAGFCGHLKVAAHSQFGANAGVLGHIKEAGTYSGWPAEPHVRWRRNVVAQKHAERTLRRVQHLETRLAALHPLLPT